MKSVLTSPEGKRVVIDPANDPCLYYAPRNPPNTGSAFTRGVDLHQHTARSGKVYYYLFPWSMWQGEYPQNELITRDEAEAFLVEKAGDCGPGGLSEMEIKKLEEYGFDLLTEDA